MSFSGLKTAVLTLVRRESGPQGLDPQRAADIAREFQQAVVDVLVAKAFGALDATGDRRLVVAGGVGANRALRARLTAEAGRRGAQVFFPDLEFCTDNGAMIALVGRAAAAGMRRAPIADSRCDRVGIWRRCSRPAADGGRARHGGVSARSRAPCPSSSCRMLLRCRQNSSSAIGIIVQATGALPIT